MRNFLILGAAVFVLLACNQVNTTGEKTITQGEDTIAEVDISLSKMDAVEELSKIDEPAKNKLLFKASGTEPGWTADFYDNKLRLVVDYGKDSLLIDDKFSMSESDKSYAYSNSTTVNGKNMAISVAFSNSPCTSASGSKEDRSVSIKFNNKEYKGCGSFIK